jgi:cytochrome c-type biogenesis protein CcmH
MRLCWLLLLLLLTTRVGAAIDTHEFETDVQRLRYQTFINEMRCPKCQNQNLSGSDSPIALDLRRELHHMIVDGRSDKEIIDFMVERYGEYILYRPRVLPVTYFLWFGPLVLFIGGIIFLLVLVRRRRQQSAVAAEHQQLSEEEQRRLALLINEVAASTPSDTDVTSGATKGAL